MSHLADEELVRRARAGDVQAYGDLVERYRKLVFGVAVHSLGNVEDARDVAQDVFIRAFLRLGQVRDPARLGAWLRQVTVNECRAWAGRRRAVDPLPDEITTRDGTSATEVRLTVRQALEAIDEVSRLTVILFYLHAYSLKEIAAFLEEPVTTIKSRLRNARARLRKEMEEGVEKDLQNDAGPDGLALRITRMIEAVQKEDEAEVRALLVEDPRLVGVTEIPGAHTPLHIAASAGNASLVELLLAYGANPNALEEGDNASPLHFAAERGWLECVRLLVEAGADVNWNQDLHERGPLGWAVVFEIVQTEVAEYLLAHGARFDIFSAIALGRTDKVRALVACDPGVLRQRMSEFERRQSPIEFAADRREFEIANLLVELGSEVSLSEAAALGLVDRVAESRTDDPSVLNAALKAAVKAGQLATARLLGERGADPNYAPQGTSLLFDSIGRSDSEMSQLLLEQGADLEFQDAQWKSTPLGWQVFFGNPETVRLALNLGAKVAPNLLDLARAGERGELRRWSSGTPEGYREVHAILEAWKAPA
ncbi:MAG: sigma-70 family RNA polymerase sigma factor [Fimbriimonas sp.]